MDKLSEKVRRILETAFPSRESLDIRNDDGIIGVLVCEEFEGLEAIDRQDRIWSVLDRSLNDEEKRQIQIIVAATPAEHLGHMVAG
jgi:acid stress-induced BolA-like protein IbaG/YrbA